MVGDIAIMWDPLSPHTVVERMPPFLLAELQEMRERVDMRRVHVRIGGEIVARVESGCRFAR